MLNESFSSGNNIFLRYQGRLFMPNVDDLRNIFNEEAHGFHYSIHTGCKKMYHDLREAFR